MKTVTIIVGWFTRSHAVMLHVSSLIQIHLQDSVTHPIYSFQPINKESRNHRSCMIKSTRLPLVATILTGRPACWRAKTNGSKAANSEAHWFSG